MNKYLNFLLFFINLQYVSIISILKLLFTKNRGCYNYSGGMKNYFNLDYKIKVESDKISKEKCIFLLNHTSWSDFFIDTYVTHAATYLARYLVIGGILFAGLYGYLSGNIEYFKRGKNKLEIVEKKIINNINSSINKQFIAYPEGTRNKTNQIMKLRSGLARIAYKNNIPCQIIIISNKDKVMNEKKLKIKKGITCEIMASKIIYPKDFENFDDFFENIKVSWKINWNKCFDKNIKSIPYQLDDKLKDESEIIFYKKNKYFSLAFLLIILTIFLKFIFV